MLFKSVHVNITQLHIYLAGKVKYDCFMGVKVISEIFSIIYSCLFLNKQN